LFLTDQNREADGKAALPMEPAPSQGVAEAFQQRARLAEDRLAEVLGAYRKLKSENEGYRDRITRNLERRFDQRRERLLLRFIEILDNLDRALEAAEVSYAGNPLIEGLILVRTQLLQTLQEEGLERIPVVGLPYDPGVSEAVETRPVEDPDQHHVVLRDLQRGYRLNGRVARASKVVVGDYQAEGVSPSAPLDTPLADAAPQKSTPAEPNPDDSVPPTAADKLLAEFEPLLDNLQKKDDRQP
jgi:molecular chaperone GrpE